jgi:hypothetical protein
MLASLNIGGATILAFIVVAVVVLALAGYLLAIALTLKKVSFTLGTVIIGVKAIANQTTPVAEVVGGIASNVIAIQNALRGVLGLPPAGKGAGAPAPAPPAPPAPAPRAAPAPAPSGGTGPVSMGGRSTSRAAGRSGGTGPVSLRR